MNPDFFRLLPEEQKAIYLDLSLRSYNNFNGALRLWKRTIGANITENDIQAISEEM